MSKHLEIDARACCKDNNVEITCNGIGTENILTGAIQAVCDMASNSMNKNLGIRIYATAIAGAHSSYDETSIYKLSKNRIKFNMKRALNDA